MRLMTGRRNRVRGIHSNAIRSMLSPVPFQIE